MSGRARVVAIVAVAPVLAAAGLILGIRMKYPPVVGLVRRLARDSGNPRVLKTAGTVGGLRRSSSTAGGLQVALSGLR